MRGDVLLEAVEGVGEEEVAGGAGEDQVVGAVELCPVVVVHEGGDVARGGVEGVDPGGEAGDEGGVEEEGFAAADGPVDEAGVEGAAVDA